MADEARAWYDPRRWLDWHNSLTTTQKILFWAAVALVVFLLVR